MGSVVREREARQTASDRTAAAIVLAGAARKGLACLSSPTRAKSSDLRGLAATARPTCCSSSMPVASSDWLPGRDSDVAFVAGDRSLNGTFPLWCILRNLSIASLGAISARRHGELAIRRQALGEDWKKRIEIRTPDMQQSHPVAFRRQPAESAVCPGAGHVGARPC